MHQSNKNSNSVILYLEPITHLEIIVQESFKQKDLFEK